MLLALLFKRPRVSDINFTDTVHVPTCSPGGKVLTVLAHCIITAAVLTLASTEVLDIPVLQLTVIHCAMLLGAWGPKAGQFDNFWVPDPVHEVGGVCIFLLIGLVEFIGDGIISFGQLHVTECSDNDNTLIWFVEQSGADQTQSVADFTAQQLMYAGCTVDAVTGAAVGPGGCSGCSCAPCPLSMMVGFAAAVPNPAATNIKDGIATYLATTGCEWIPALSGYHMPMGTFIDKLWYAFVLLTTVGYGNTFTPPATAARIYTICWALYGLLLFGAASSTVIECINRVISFFNGLCTKAMNQVHVRDDAGSAAEETAVAAAFKPHPSYHVMSSLFGNFMAFILVNVIGIVVFVSVEDDMLPIDAFYHSIMTATTIGLGDLAPQTQAGRLYGILHMLLCTIIFGSILGTLLNVLDTRRASLKKAEMLRRQLDEDLITSLDKNGDGVDKLEFVLGMLEKLDLISEDDYAPFLAQFDKLDVTKDGRLNRDDLAALAKINLAQRKEAAEAKEVSMKAAPQTLDEKLHKYASDLLLPTFLMCFAFLWHTVFGYVMLAAGIMHAVAIGILLGSPPSLHNYRKVVTLLILGGITILVAVAMQGMSTFNMVWYMETFDPLMQTMVFGEFNDNGFTVIKDQATIDMFKSAYSEMSTSPSMTITMVLYLSTYCAAAVIDVMAIVHSCKAMSMLRVQVTEHPSRVQWG